VDLFKVEDFWKATFEDFIISGATSWRTETPKESEFSEIRFWFRRKRTTGIKHSSSPSWPLA